MLENKKVLVLFAHPSPERSEINLPLFKAAQQIDGVTTVDLYAEYPTFRIDIDKEQQRLREHDVVIFLFPMYWYSTPSLLKEWQDLVLEYGFAYGPEGDELYEKRFMCALTAGGSEKAYQAEGYNHFTIRELLQPLEQTAALTGMTYLAPFALFGSRTAVEESRIEEHIEQWQRLLIALHYDQIDLQVATSLNKINDDLESVIKGRQ